MTALEYHNRTKHSPESVRQSAHYLDWSNQPLAFKVYRSLVPMPLPRETVATGIPALAAVVGTAPRRDVTPDLSQLGHLLRFSAGVTKRKRYPGGEILFRAAACTGALYEIELYLVCSALPGLDAGVYHFGPADMALRRLRDGDWRGVVAAATADEETAARAPIILISTGTYWRNAWKYQARTYRHFGWDNGTIHANLLAMAAALDLPARLLCGFVDEQINRLLDLDTEKEVALAFLALGQTTEPAPAPPPEIPPLGYETVPLSRREVDYPLMREMHAASSLATPGAVAVWREPIVGPGTTPGEVLVPDGIEDVILRRGSTRQFGREPITLAQLTTVLAFSTRGIPADFAPDGGGHLNDVYLIANAVEGLAPGAYFYRQPEGELQSLRAGSFRNEAAFLALEQDLAGDAAVAVFFLSDFGRWLERFGNRGYRAVQIEAGILGGKMYLAAYAQRLGATGLTFYDDEVVKFFSPHAAGKSAIFLVAIGHAARRLG